MFEFEFFRMRVIAGLCISCLSTLTWGQAQRSGDLTGLTIEELMKIEVTSPTKRAQPLDSVPAAITVITQDDIRRSGARNLAEAMRLAPGVQVQELSVHYYAITIRGFDNPNFDGSYGNKLLVLVDGRTLYSPYSSTVYWEVEDLILEDIDRIEVIRGPGGSLYGANAVNGVINIITKSAAKTLGGMTVSSKGSLEEDRMAVRYGWQMGEHAAFRIFSKLGTDGTSMNPDGTSAADGGSLREFGFRGDIDGVKGGSLMLQGAYNRFGIYENQVNPILVPPYSQPATNKDLITASHLLGLWKSKEQSGAQTSIQAYYDVLAYPYSNASSTGTTYDLDLQRRIPGPGGRELIVGGGYRYEINGSSPGAYPYQELVPATRHDSIFNLFAQDEMPAGDRGRLTLGAKLEHNTFSGFEFEPSVRYLYRPNSSQVFWAAVSRAVRTPSQSELNDHVLISVTPPDQPGGLPTASISFGNPALTSEVLWSNEAGYRLEASSRLSLDFAAFYNIYTNLIHSQQGDPIESVEFGVPVLLIPTMLESGERGNVYGFELQSRWAASPRLQVTGSYSYVGQNHFTFGTLIDAPMHQLGAGISYDQSNKLSFDGRLYWYSAVPDLGASAYAKLDLQMTWRPSKNLEFSLAGQDLLYPHHSTFDGYFDIPKSVYLKMTSRF